MSYLIVRQTDRVAFSAELRDGLSIGRQDQNDIVLDDAKVSRRHAAFSHAEGRWTLRDLGSMHGTLVNGERISSRTLSDGDRIQIGQVLLTFLEHYDGVCELVRERPTAIESQRSVAAGRRLHIFYDVARAIGEIGDTEALLCRMLETILDVLGCERGLIGLRDGEGSGLRRIVRTRGEGGAGELVLSRSLLEATLDRRKAVLVNEASQTHSLMRQRVLSAMSVPLLSSTRVLGLLYVDDRGKADQFTDEDLDFLTALGHLTGAALESAERYQRAAAVAEALGAESQLGELIGTSDAMQRLRVEIRKYAAAGNGHVLIRGESGTGKELVARTLHALSPRSSHPLVTLNCAAMPESMIESELFGYEKGAFTGAVRDKKGKFVLANRGTLFLDEIGDLSAPAQAKVLRAIQEGEIQPLGSERTLRVDVRVLSATHKDLSAEVAAGRFREDLFYRLNVLEVTVPPLRERDEDIPLLASAFLAAAATRLGKRLSGFSPQAPAALRRYRWPGNIRELQNEAERAAIIAEGQVVDIGDLSSRISGARASAAPEAPRPLAERFAALEPTEKALVEEALTAARGNISEAARLLGISRIMMKKRVTRFGLSEDE